MRSIAAEVAYKISIYPKLHPSEENMKFSVSSPPGVINGGKLEVLSEDKLQVVTGVFRKRTLLLEGEGAKKFAYECEKIFRSDGTGRVTMMLRSSGALEELSRNIKKNESEFKISLMIDCP